LLKPPPLQWKPQLVAEAGVCYLLVQGAGFQNDGRTDQSGWPYKQSAPTGDEAIREAEMGSALARAIEDEQLMSDEDGLRESKTDAATCKSSGRGEEMNEKDHEIAHIDIVARN
jgi:hypothetical protein